MITLPQLKKKVQRAVNARIRERDRNNGCISCDKMCGSPQCGHFIAMGSSSYLRYHPWNLNLQGTGCNTFKRGNLIEYRIGLVKKIGVKKVEWLEDHRHDIKKWTREELNRIIDYAKEDSYDELYINDKELYKVSQ